MSDRICQKCGYYMGSVVCTKCGTPAPQPVTPPMEKIRARDVIPYEWAQWCSIGNSPPFENPIVLVGWNEDGTELSFMLDSFNFMFAKPDDILELVRQTPSKYTNMDEVRRKHAERMANRPSAKPKCGECGRPL